MCIRDSYKWVLDEADLVVNPDLSINTSRAGHKISDYDRNAIQVAIEAAGEGDEVVALTYAGAVSYTHLDVYKRQTLGGALTEITLRRTAQKSARRQ